VQVVVGAREDELPGVREQLTQVDAVLAARGLGRSPACGPEVFREDLPTVALHALRVAYARWAQGVPLGGFTPPLGDARDQELVDDLRSDLENHLLCHSDREGWYLPIDLVTPVIHRSLPGAAVGSVVRLRYELEDLEAPLTEVAGHPPAAWGGLPYDSPVGPACLAWRTLWAACEASLDSGSPMRFA
jgi:hypothetical protein